MKVKTRLTVLAALHVLLDGRAAAKSIPAVFCLAFGMNAIAAYVLHILIADVVKGDIFTAPYQVLAPLIGGRVAELVPIALFLLLVWLPLEYLRRRGWVIKV